jgi:hypothetical protein
VARALAEGRPAEERFQFERHGYFVADRVDSKEGAPVFNRTVTLKDSWLVIPAKAGIQNCPRTGPRHPKGTSCGARSPG